MKRRSFLLSFVGALLGCKRAANRCELCGMTLDPSSPWLAELVGTDGATHRFDTPKCALLAWRTGKVPARATRFQEFYERVWRDGATLVFAVGSDVIGPMGGDTVPIDPTRAPKFEKDHGATRVVRLEELTAQVLQAL
jgi:hypothetical protein